MERNAAELIIAILYGTDTETGRQLLRDLLADMGLAALTDAHTESRSGRKTEIAPPLSGGKIRIS